MFGIRVLLVTDRLELRQLLRATLRQLGAELSECRRLRDATKHLGRSGCDVLLLDLSLSGTSAEDATRMLRSQTKAPLIALSSSRDDEKKFAIFEAGADDYLALPLNERELLARMRASLRLSLRALSPAAPPAELDEIELDSEAHELRFRGRSVHLTPTESKLLKVLLASAGRFVTHRRLLSEVWGPKSMNQIHYLRMYMKQLRRKLELLPRLPDYLVAEPSLGYSLRVPA
jgi:two-component system KDP operon response regulator KdpE